LPMRLLCIFICEVCERFAYYGPSLLFIVYCQDYLGLTSNSASAVSRGFNFLSYFTAIIGAVVSDSLFGKFKTIFGFACWYLIGLVILSCSAIGVEAGNTSPGAWPLAGFFVSIFCFISWGTGGIKANVSAFAAEQIPLGNRPTKDPKVFIGYDATVERLFQFFYWAINVGSFLGQLISPIIYHSVGKPAISYGVAACIFVPGIIVFVLGKNQYHVNEIKGNPLFKAFRCIKMGFANRKSMPAGGHFLDTAKGKSDEWDDKYVDDLKRTMKGCKIFPFYIGFWALYYNINDNFINTGLNMEGPWWLQAEQLVVVANIALIVLIPVFDTLVIPALRKMGFKLGPVTRIIIGYAICVITFIYATVLEHFVYSTGPYYSDLNKPLGATEYPKNHISIWWQIPVYVCVAIAEIFASATGLEFAYKYAAPELKSLVMALYLFMTCLGNLVGMILAIWSSHPNFVVLFAVECSALGVLTFIFFLMYRNLDDE
ncbi:hypothetical protein CONCODRAFT_23097, partial [Conidiobolus coronatus NRRL 28638]